MNPKDLKKEFKKNTSKASFIYLLEIFNKEKISNFNNNIFDKMTIILEKYLLDNNKIGEAKKKIITSIIKEEIIFFLENENPFKFSILFYDFRYKINLNKCVLEITNYKPYHKELVSNFLKQKHPLLFLVDGVETNSQTLITNGSFFYDKALSLEFCKSNYDNSTVINSLIEELNKNPIFFFNALKILETNSIKFKNLSLRIFKILFKNNLIDCSTFEDSVNKCFYASYIKNKKSLYFSLEE
jgi:hypothetical protein